VVSANFFMEIPCLKSKSGIEAIRPSGWSDAAFP
jgi:hypothetical protein